MLPWRGIREITRSASGSAPVPVPFAFAACLAFAGFCLRSGQSADGLMRWIFVGFAVVAVAGGLGLFIFAALRRPELLRSERHVLTQRLFQFAEDSGESPPNMRKLEILGRHVSTAERTGKTDEASASPGYADEDDDGN
jgi:hypothetical protein